jgi:AraC family transcriptional regulator, regulatory protein of adaptative response / DNA-3-methyladenine glycosylase II
MDLNSSACYQAMKAHDTRFDGRFFVGVTSTKIYCRPICRVRIPLLKNCTFHPSAAAAEVAGFRPCLKCRPELAPGFAATEASAKLARAAARMIEDGVANELDLVTLSQKIGVTARHLRRIFADEFGVSPVQFAQTQRLLLAKRLMTDTTMSVTDVAFASGFSSVRRMNTLFAERYGFAPTRLRKDNAAGDAAYSANNAKFFTFYLTYRPPYDWAGILAFLEKRAIPNVEAISSDEYRRILRSGHSGRDNHPDIVCWIRVRHVPRKHALEVTLSPAFAKALPQVLATIKRVFDLHADPVEISDAIGGLAKANKGLRLPGAFDGFELAVRAVLGQQVTVKAARTLAIRFVNAFGEKIAFDDAPPFDDLSKAFPTPAKVATLTQDDIASLGIVSARANAIIAIAAKVAAGELDLSSNAVVENTIESLQMIKGIGPWTAHYIAMRALSWPDAFPPQDVAILNALDLPNTKAGQRDADVIAEQWQPWRSYAVLHLWNSLEIAK